MGNPYSKLKSDYEHLMDRTWKLFTYGKEREGRLEAVIANAWKQFEILSKCKNITESQRVAEAAKVFVSEALKEHHSTEPLED